MSGGTNTGFSAPARALHGVLERLSPRQRQYALLAAILVCGIGLLWMVFEFADGGRKDSQARPPGTAPSAVTHIGVMPPGQQVNPVDQWVGTAGTRLAQYESEREQQERLNKERREFEAQTMKRFAELEQRLTAAGNAAPSAAPTMPTPAPVSPALMPPAPSLPLPPPLPAPPLPGTRTSTPPGAMPPGSPLAPAPAMPSPASPAAPVLTRISLVARTAESIANAGASGGGGAMATRPTPNTDTRTVSTFLPVSFTRGTLLGGLDAPTGGQSQSNPHPVLIRLADDSVLPNRLRGQYRECFVVAAGYGDISAERAYLRTENLSCVRADGAALEVKIQGTVYGEDGKVGMRGRLVTKQGQMLANALLAGVVSGIGQGLSTSSTSYSTSPIGTVASATGADAYKAGLGAGIGRALDRLAQYYIKLAENTFPVIEVDAGREIDVVITRGVRIDVPMAAGLQTGVRTEPMSSAHDQEATDDGDD